MLLSCIMFIFFMVQLLLFFLAIGLAFAVGIIIIILILDEIVARINRKKGNIKNGTKKNS